MAIPDSGSGWGLTDVRVELGLGATSSLTDCFSAASPGSFDPTYEGSKDRLSNFRNYGASAGLTSFLIDITPSGSALAACLIAFSPITYYHDGAGPIPGLGDTIFSNIGGTFTFDGGGNYYQCQADGGGAAYSLRIGGSGQALTGSVPC